MYDDLFDDLALDGYAVPYDIPGRLTYSKSLANIAIHLQNEENTAAWSVFQSFLSEKKYSSIVFSSEELDKPSVNITKLKHASIQVKLRSCFTQVSRKNAKWFRNGMNKEEENRKLRLHLQDFIKEERFVQ